MAEIRMKLEPFRFPNFLRLAGQIGPGFHVGRLSDDEAAAYWDDLKAEWLEHVRKKRDRYTETADAD